MAQAEFDTVVIGAGMAGLACAGELVRHGQRPLLICETKEVGAMYAVQEIGESSRAFVQHLTWQPSWGGGGGWWYPLARALDVPVQLYPGVGFSATLAGSGVISDLPLCVSASGMVAVVTNGLGWPLDDASRESLQRVMAAALAIPVEELLTMHMAPLAQWLQDNGANELVSMFFLLFGGAMNGMDIPEATEHLSVFGGLASIRGCLFGEAQFPIPYPNLREGLCIPLAQAIDRRGGTVWRGRRVERVLIDDGTVTGVRLVDGTEVVAPLVAIATGNARIPAILDPLPAEVEASVAYTARLASRDIALFSLLGKPVMEGRHVVGSVSLEGSIHWVEGLHAMAPWTTEPGKQLLITWAKEEAGVAGDMDKTVAVLMDRTEELFPGFKDAIVDQVYSSRPHNFTTPLAIGPKIPRTIDSVDGLWFVGDGSTPCAGIWTEGAASCGILGARAMMAKSA